MCMCCRASPVGGGVSQGDPSGEELMGERSRVIRVR